MLKIASALLTLACCATVSAEPIVYICERPAWEGVEGCGPNNTAYVYGFWVDTEDFDHNVDKERLWYNKPRYQYTVKAGCDLFEAKGRDGRFTVSDEAIEFWLGPDVSNSTKVELDTIAMTAKLSGHKIRQSPDMTCEEVKSDAIALHPKIGGAGRASPTLFWPSSHMKTKPASAVKSTHTVQ